MSSRLLALTSGLLGPHAVWQGNIAWKCADVGLNRREFVSAAGLFGAGQVVRPGGERRRQLPCRFRVQSIAVPGGGTYAYDLNSAGCVTGTFDDRSTGARSPFLFRAINTQSAWEFAPIRTLLGAEWRQLSLSGPPAINDAGILAGAGSAASFRSEEGIVYRLHPPAVETAPWRLEQGPRLGPGRVATSVRMNAAGDVAFIARDMGAAEMSGTYVLYVWLAGATEYMKAASVGAGAELTACATAAGELFLSGCVAVADAEPKGFHFRIDPKTNLASACGKTTRGSRWETILGMNARGESVGVCCTSLTKGFVERGFQRIESVGTMTLGTLGGRRSVGFSVNSRGDVVGRADLSMTADGAAAFLFADFRMVELASLIDDAIPTALSRAQLLINDVGHIAGNVEGPFAPACAGESAFLLVPISEGSSAT